MTSSQMVSHPFFSKENIGTKQHEMHLKKAVSMGEKPSFKLER